MRTVRPEYEKHYAPGYCLFVRNTQSFIGTGIIWFQSVADSDAWITQDPFIPTHTVLVVDERVGLESAARGIRPCRLDHYFDSPYSQVVIREPIGLHDSAASQAIDYGLTMVGRIYDFPGFVGKGLEILAGLSRWIKLLRKLPAPLHFPGARYCSAYTADCYKHTTEWQDIELFRQWHVTRITPRMLWNDFPFKPFRLG